MVTSVQGNFFKGLSIQTIVSVTIALLQLIVFAIFSRLLTREEFGYYAALMGVIAIFTSISDAGIGSALIQKNNASEKYLSTAFSLSIFFGTVISLLSFSLSGAIANTIADETLVIPLRILSICVFLYSVQGVAVCYFRKQLDFKTVGLCKIASYVLSSIIAICLALYGVGLYSLIILYLLDSIFYTLFIYSKLRPPKISFNLIDVKEIVSFGGWLTLGVIVTNISNQLDKLLLGNLLSVGKLGEYNRPSGFINNIIAMINTIFDTVLFPILSQLQDQADQASKILFRTNYLLSSFGGLLSALLIVNSHLIILFFFGGEWVDIVPIMQICSFSAIFMMNNTLSDCFFRSFNLVKQGFYIRLSGLFISVSFLFVGAKAGIMGVAIAVLLSNLLTVVIKTSYLCYSFKASLLLFWYNWLKSLIPAMPIFVMLVVYLLMPKTFISLLILAVISLQIILFELFVTPHLFGEDFQSAIYPRIIELKNKILK